MDSRIIQYWRIYSDYIPWLLGASLVTLIVFGVVYLLRRRDSQQSVITKTILECIITLCLVFIAFVTMLPTGINQTHLINLNITTVLLFRGDIEYIINLFIFIPLGFALYIRLKRIEVAMLIGAGVSLCIEILQYLLPLGRVASIDDLILNILGTAIGVLIAGGYTLFVTRKVNINSLN